MDKEKKCKPRNVVKVCDRWGKNSRQCKKILEQCSK